MAAFGAADEPAQWKIYAEVLSRWPIGFPLEARLNFIVRLERYQRRMLAFCKRYIPLWKFVVTRIEHIAQYVFRTLISETSFSSEFRPHIQKALHLGL
ncbi:MAG: hypothetical protein NXH95_15965 [Pseudomonadaceae bacterium]|nr:hypothetical protein [Pseudomonadaceae bacterium]